MEMKRTILSFSFVLAAMLAHAQLTLEGCQHSAQTNYPLVRQYGLIEKAREYNLENAGKGYLPQFTLGRSGNRYKKYAQRSVSGDAGSVAEHLGRWRYPFQKATDPGYFGDRPWEAGSRYVWAE